MLRALLTVLLLVCVIALAGRGGVETPAAQESSGETVVPVEPSATGKWQNSKEQSKLTGSNNTYWVLEADEDQLAHLAG